MAAEDARYQRASSILPAGSSVKRAMTGFDHGDPDMSDPDPMSGSEGECSSTESNVERNPKARRQKSSKSLKKRKETRKLTKNLDETSTGFGIDFLVLEPDSDHDSDSDTTKRSKWHAKLNLLKYQQGFIKNKPPFMYNGDANATTFKKWVHEVRDWKDRACLTPGQSIKMLGKYLGGQAYRFYE